METRISNSITNNQTGAPSRIEALDFARSLAILLVVLNHVTENIYSLGLNGVAELSTKTKIFAFCSFTLGRIGVPIFLFLTGYLLLDQTYDTTKEVITFWKKKLIPLIITFEFWTVFNEAFGVFVLGQEFDLVYFLQRIFFVRASAFGHMWYMPMIIGIYFMIPFVSYVLNHFSLKLLLIPAGVCFIYYFISANLNSVATAVDFPGFSNRLSIEFTGGTYGLYIFCGYFVKKSHQWILQFKKSHRGIVPGLLILSVIFYVMTVAFQLWSYSHEQAYNVFYGFAPLLITALCLFIAITVMPDEIPFYNIWNQLSVASFGIYFVHYPVMRAILKYDVWSLKSMDIIKPLKVFIVFVIVFIISFIIVKVLSRWKKLSKILWLR